MQHRQAVSVSSEQSIERWQAIVDALVAHGIGPDIVTFAALSLGADALAHNLGIDPAKRTVGFAPEQR